MKCNTELLKTEQIRDKLREEILSLTDEQAEYVWRCFCVQNKERNARRDRIPEREAAEMQ